jgi:hypothetical protein
MFILLVYLITLFCICEEVSIGQLHWLGQTIMAVATKDEEMETGTGEDDAKVGLLQDQMSDAAVTENFLGGPALSVDTVFHFPQNPTECM